MCGVITLVWGPSCWYLKHFGRLSYQPEASILNASIPAVAQDMGNHDQKSGHEKHQGSTNKR